MTVIIAESHRRSPSTKALHILHFLDHLQKWPCESLSVKIRPLCSKFNCNLLFVASTALHKNAKPCLCPPLSSLHLHAGRMLVASCQTTVCQHSACWRGNKGWFIGVLVLRKRAEWVRKFHLNATVQCFMHLQGSKNTGIVTPGGTKI